MSGPRPGQVRAAALHHPPHPKPHRFPLEALEVLACPHCGSGLVPGDGILECSNAHVFDVAKQGYVALLGARARTDTGDSADMVAARIQFLATGHYLPIAAAVASMTSATVRRAPIVEIGAGTGYYLAAALDAAGSGACGIALDSSKYAARRAAADGRVISVVADAWSALPIQGGSVGTVLSVFAPRTAEEIVRVLQPGGTFVAVTPLPHHLIELRQRLAMLTVDEGKAARLAESFAGALVPLGEEFAEFSMRLGHADIAALVRMGPSARHLPAPQLVEQIDALEDELTVTAAVTVSSFQLVSEPGGTSAPRRE